MFKKPQTWLFVLFGACIVGGALGVFAFGDSAGQDSLLAASAVALIVGSIGFLVLVVWLLRKEGVTPLTEQQVRAAGTIGEVVGHVVGSAVVWGFASAGLAALMGQRGGTLFWIVTAGGVLIGALLGYWRSRRFARGGTKAQG